MKQKNFLNNSESESVSCKEEEINYWKLFIDGAARNNPGPAGAGVYILKNDELFEKRGFYLGIKTNNQAEYLALLLGIFYAKKNISPCDIILIVSDSQLLIRQMEGKYKIKNSGLRPLLHLAIRLLSDINYSVLHVPRDQNTDADEMANVGIDKKKKLPKDFLEMLQNYEIQL